MSKLMMGCCGKNDEDKDDCANEPNPEMKKLCKMAQTKDKTKDTPYSWHPTASSMQQIAYVRGLENQHEALQLSYVNLSTEVARIQFLIRQLEQAAPSELKQIIHDLEHVVFKTNDIKSRNHELPSLQQYNLGMGNIKEKQHVFIRKLRQQIGSFEEAAENLTTEKSESEEQDKEIEKKCGPAVQVTLIDKPSIINQDKSELVYRESEIKSRKLGGSEYFVSSATSSRETCNSLEHESSVRSISFKELRDMYQRECEKRP